METKQFQLDCLFLFNQKIQNVFYDFGPGGVLACIQAKAMIKDNGSCITYEQYYRIADYCKIDKRILDIIATNYNLFESDGEFIWLYGQNREKEYYQEMPYQEFLQTEYWKNVSAKVKKNANFKCSKCGSNKRLEVHHINYNHHGDEMNHIEDLICICHDCHSKLHNK